MNAAAVVYHHAPDRSRRRRTRIFLD